MIVSTKLSVRVADFYFDEEPKTVEADVIRYIQSRMPVPHTACTPFHTILIDLTFPEEHLLEGVRYNTRYKIKRAADRDNLIYCHWESPEPAIISDFCEFYDRFAVSRRRAPISRLRLLTLAQSSSLDLSVIYQTCGDPLIWHAFYRSKERVRLLESPSLFKNTEDTLHRNLVGRANRYHHWQDMLRFKAQGVLTYDLGGWAPHPHDQEAVGINRFKEEFGGQIVKNFNCHRAVTLKGKLALGVLGLLKSGWPHKISSAALRLAREQ